MAAPGSSTTELGSLTDSILQMGKLRSRGVKAGVLTTWLGRGRAGILGQDYVTSGHDCVLVALRRPLARLGGDSHVYLAAVAPALEVPGEIWIRAGRHGRNDRSLRGGHLVAVAPLGGHLLVRNE
jgi:hypothetical protein